MPLADYLSAPIGHLQTLVANSATFRTLVGAASVSAARASIYKGDAPGDWTATRAIVGSTGGRQLSKSSSTGWQFEGDLFVLFEIDQTANSGDHNAAHDAFVASIDNILDDILPLCGSDDGTTQFLDVIEITEDVPPLPCDRDFNQGKYFWWTAWRVRHHA